MGTRGLLFVRCCGRYFTYYNRYDSYPEGLGDAIVKEIPEDPDKYRGKATKHKLQQDRQTDSLHAQNG